MKILAVTSEMVPYAKTGGLADVMGALPQALGRQGHDVRVFLPLYDTIEAQHLRLEVMIESMEVQLGAHRYGVRVVRDLDNPAAYLVYCPALYHRGRLYTRDGDEHRRFLVLGLAALHAAQRMGFAPDVVHCHDWQASLLPLLLRVRFGWDRLFAGSRTLLTIHNLNYQGRLPASALPDLHLSGSEHLLHQEQLRGGMINLLLHGILYADGVSTVSPTYAREIQTPERGAELDAFLRARTSTVVGVLNGVDYGVWSPEVDPHLAHRYSADTLDGKEANKEALLREAGLPYVPGVPLIGVVSRLVGQKGFELLPEVLPRMLARGEVQLVALGSGEARIEGIFERLQQRFPRQVAFLRAFSNPVAHRIEAGADLFLMPSRYEPCGLNQLYSLRYGTVPVVHQTGGLADTVQLWSPRDGSGTGFPFAHYTAEGLRWALGAAVEAYRDRGVWRQLQRNGMAQDYSWDRQAGLYSALFERLTR